MATAMVTDTMAAQAQTLLMRAARWPKAFDRNGVLIGYSFRSSRTLADGTPVYHLTRISPTISCSCEGYRHRSVCSHSEAVRQHEDRHARTVEAARARYAEQKSATATSWRKCVRSWCEALLPPESFERFCDPCNEKDRALLARAFGED